ncbi:MAG: hypothetical protein HY675_07880 [Chloroflexi bacterium]|nr:hypothetical protein [Chloroflexota bacterium]
MGTFDLPGRDERDAVRFEGGPGETPERAIRIVGAPNEIVGVHAEYQYLEKRFGRRGVDLQLESQSLHVIGGRYYDRIEIRLADGSGHVLYFDITDFFGRIGPDGPHGCTGRSPSTLCDSWGRNMG